MKISADDVEPELVTPESEEDDEDDDILTVVDEDVGDEELANQAADSLGVSRRQKQSEKGTSGQTKAPAPSRKRTGGEQRSDQSSAKRKAPSKFYFLFPYNHHETMHLVV